MFVKITTILTASSPKVKPYHSYMIWVNPKKDVDIDLRVENTVKRNLAYRMDISEERLNQFNYSWSYCE